MNFKKQWGIWLGLAIIVAFSLLAISALTRNSSAPLTTDAVAEGDHVLGNPAAKAVLIAYEDFQCPACALYAPVIKQLSEEFPDTLAIVFRHFPLRTIHANADAAAAASEAADRQGKFWEMAEMLYSRQSEWERAADAKAKFAGYAAELGLDAARFAADMNLPEIEAKIDAAYAAATRLRINSTPTFFLNGKQLVTNPSSYDAFKALVQAQIAQ